MCWGVVVLLGGRLMQLLRPWLVDNAGHVVDRFGLSYPVCRGRLFSCAGDYEPLYLSGAFSIYRVDVLRKGVPFSDVYEAYFDDKLLGARLRRRGYRTFHKAIVAGFISVLLVMARVGFLSRPGGLSTSP